jgi:hypothetical protein
MLRRDALNYGWEYAGPLGGSLEELDRVVNTINMRKHERFTKQQAAAMAGAFDIAGTSKMLEVARRQGLITSSFENGPNGEKQRVYHSWEYQEPDLDFESNHSPAAPAKESDSSLDDEFF